MDARMTADEHVRRIIRLHFDAERGAPYWLRRQAELGINVIAEVATVADLAKLGPMNEVDLCDRPVLDFVPESQRGRLIGATIAETGGTTGMPKRTLFTRSEFDEAFVTPFVRAAEHAGFPVGGAWLWFGPSGPHIIAQAAAACAEALGAPRPFSVDFDPRWYCKMPVESLGRTRYLDHLLAQAMHLVNHEPIDVLFTTPGVLEKLAERMSDRQRERIRGVHYGGMRVTPDLLRRAQVGWFPNAVHLAGYGNSLFGVCMEFGGPPDRTLAYFPYGHRHVVRVADDGRVWMSRLDESVLIANLPERDAGAPVSPPDTAPSGFGCGVEDPQGLRTVEHSSEGLY